MSTMPVAYRGQTMPVAASGTTAARSRADKQRTLGQVDARADPAWVRGLVIALAVMFLGLFIVLPLVCVFTQAFAKGVDAYFAAIRNPDVSDPPHARRCCPPR